MNVGEFIKILQEYPETDTVVVVGCSWFGSNEPEFFESEPEVISSNQKVRIGV